VRSGGASGFSVGFSPLIMRKRENDKKLQGGILMKCVSKRTSILLLAGLLMLAGLLPLTAGGQKAGSEQAIELSVWTNFSWTDEVTKVIAERYTAKHPNVTFDVTLYPQRTLDQKIAIALPAKQGPDMFDAATRMVMPFGHLLHPLSDETVEYMDSLVPESCSKLLEMAGYQGKPNIIAYYTNPGVWYYNREHWKEAGLKEGVPATLDGVMDYARKLVKYDSAGNIVRSGVGLRLGGGGVGIAQKFVLSLLQPYGGEAMIAKGGKWCQGYDGPPGRNAVKFYVDALHKYKVESSDVKHEAEGFALGVISMYYRESQVISQLADLAPDLDYWVDLCPGAVRRGTAVNYRGLTIVDTTEYPEVCEDFGRFFLEKDNQYWMFETFGNQPVRTKEDYSAIYEKEPRLKIFMDSFNTPGYETWFQEPTPAYQEVYGKMADRLVSAYRDASLVDNPDKLARIVHEMAVETNQILKEQDEIAPGCTP